jgi:hypothetical protein
MSELSVGELKGLAVNNNTITVPSGHTLYAPGSVIQVVNVENVTRTSQGVSGSTLLDISGLEATITPKRNTSKIIIQARWFGEFSVVDMQYNSVFGVSRNGTQIGRQPDPGATIISGITSPAISYDQPDGNSTPESMSFFLSDSPNSTSALTYRITYLSAIAGTIFTNRTVGWANQASLYELGTSGLMLMEVAQ